jgi:hypothetical protein
MLDFYKFVQSRQAELEAFEERIRAEFDLDSNSILRLTGEYCGPGVQTKVGISNVAQRIWVLFDVTVYDGATLEQDMEKKKICQLDMYQKTVKSLQIDDRQLYVITNYKTFEVKIDLARKNGKYDEPVKNSDDKTVMLAVIQATNEVANSCPVAQALGVSGPGEGIVWEAVFASEHKDLDGWQFAFFFLSCLSGLMFKCFCNLSFIVSFRCQNRPTLPVCRED